MMNLLTHIRRFRVNKFIIMHYAFIIMHCVLRIICSFNIIKLYLSQKLSLTLCKPLQKPDPPY